MMGRQRSARAQRSAEVQWRLQQCERHKGGHSNAERHKEGCSSARGTEVFAAAQRQQRKNQIAAEVVSASGGFYADKDVSTWVDQLLTSR